MSPKKITQLAMIVAGLSILGMVIMAISQSAWGIWNWWPAIGLGISLLLLVISFLRGAYLTAQQRVAMVDKLNDCYTGSTEQTS